ncbi:hypothetical protein VSS74_14015 [Conexibacter stalactiti]|uniref:Secreted protein n=1 Tax=Conexibacter stalactiti TaxID=1940611 RepID=A0ABU4HQ62_9ACTN|nr:hypothetical protein [Conexibacter stalactiti]MDW5595461.1 hypothetical protein [Conexibacter stalactiti]MEC5036103.1 hypothetical protein [Conexibacter stalactiti]
MDGKAPRTKLRVVVVLLAMAALAVGGCGGDSDEEQAQAAVCDARDDIAQQVGELANLTLTTATVDQVRNNLETIQDDLTTISDNRSELSDDRRQEVETATTRFTDEVRDVVSTLGRSLSLSDARTQLSTALTQLGSAYRSTLAQVQCD